MKHIGVFAACALAFSSLFAAPHALAAETNLALDDAATVSSSGQEVSGQWGPELTKDNDKGGDFATRDVGENFRNPTASRWSAPNQDEVWLQLDLGVKAEINSVTVTWGKQYSTNFELQVSADGQKWDTVRTGLSGSASQEQTIDLRTEGKGLTAQSVRLVSHQRSSTWSIGIWEFEVFGTALGPVQPQVQLPALVPLPASYTAGNADEIFTLDPAAELIAADNALAEVEPFAQKLRAATGYELPIVSASTDDIADLTFVNLAKTNLSGTAAEHYTLSVSENGVTVTGDTAHGLFDGVQTLAQLFGPWVGFTQTTTGPWTIPALEIDDQPRFAHRGNMLDPARSFHTLDEMKQAIDIYSQYKFNVLHVHLTDDQGWRIEITNDGRKDGDTIDYTRLTAVSGKTAVGEGEGKFNRFAGKSGFYTQAEWKELVAYAKARHMTVIPEIDLPGHTNAALYAIPQLNTPGSSHDGTKNSDGSAIADPANYLTAPLQDTTAVGDTYLDFNSPATWNFIEHVVTQIVAITGSPYFHFGGDEAHDLTALDGGATYAQFVTRIANIVRDAGVTPVSWNEAMAGVQQPGDLIQLWQGNPDAVSSAVDDEGAKLIYSFNQNLYYPQKPDTNVAGPDWACSGPCNISWWYDYDPAERTGVADADIHGIEAPQWNEHVRNIQQAFFVEFPRALAAAEVGWTPQSLRNGKLADFKNRAAQLVGSLTAQGVDFYHGDGLNPQVSIAGAKVDAKAEAGAAVGYLFSPATDADNVTAEVRWDNGTTSQLRISVDRPYQPGNPENYENRAQNGIFTFMLIDAVPDNAHSGVIVATVNGVEVTSLGKVVVTAAEQTGGEQTGSAGSDTGGDNTDTGDNTGTEDNTGAGGESGKNPDVSGGSGAGDSAGTEGGSDTEGGSGIGSADSVNGTDANANADSDAANVGSGSGDARSSVGKMSDTGAHTALVSVAALVLIAAGLVLVSRRKRA